MGTPAQKLAAYKGKVGKLTQSELGVYYFVETSNPYIRTVCNINGQRFLPLKLTTN